MKKSLFFLSLLVFVFSITNANTEGKVVLIPYPNQIEFGAGSFNLSFDTPIEIRGVSEKATINFLKNQIKFPRNRSVDSQKKPSITLKILKGKDLELDEWYQLNISKKGVAIRANSSKGLLYAISTLNQILFQTIKEGYYQLPYLTIDDSPSYQFRGFMLDASRHMQSVQTVKFILDFMASIKLNVFHWHLTDDTGWRIESIKYPRLNLVGSYAIRSLDKEINGYYTIDEIHEILDYAKQRNIMVIPEFDVPGHSWSVMNTYPEFRCPHVPYSNAFCAGNDRSLPFIESLFDEIIDIFHPQYIHIGGDEREKDLWNTCPLCKKKMNDLNISNENELQNYFLNELSKYLHAKNVTTIAWAENLEGGIPKGQITQSWRLKNEATVAIKMGHQVIVSDNLECYIDYPENEKEKESKPDWMPILTTKKLYEFDFIPPNLTQEEAKLVLGGECPLWTEVVSENQIYFQIKRRIEAHAERSWTNLGNKDLDRFMKSYQKLSSYFASFFGQ